MLTAARAHVTQVANGTKTYDAGKITLEITGATLQNVTTGGPGAPGKDDRVTQTATTSGTSMFVTTTCEADAGATPPWTYAYNGHGNDAHARTADGELREPRRQRLPRARLHEEVVASAA